MFRKTQTKETAMQTKMTMSMLLLSAACATPSLANYFYNPHTNLALNIGSAPSPTPRDIRENRQPRVGHDAPSYANGVADSTTKGTGSPPMNDRTLAQGGGEKNVSAAQPQR